MTFEVCILNLIDMDEAKSKWIVVALIKFRELYGTVYAQYTQFGNIHITYWEIQSLFVLLF